MAIIHDTGKTLEITPVTPSLEGPRDAYDVRIWNLEDIIFDRQYNVAGWQAGHSEVYKIGRAFSLANQIVDATIPISLWGEDNADFDPADYLPLQIHLSVLWLEVTMSGYTFNASEHITARFYVWSGPHADYEPNVSPSQLLPSYQACELHVRPKEAIRFGIELAKECRATQVLRHKLKIDHYDDHIEFA